MDLVTGIAAESIALSTAKVQTQVDLAVTRKAMEQQETAAEGFLQMLPSTVPGRYLDTEA